MNRRTHFRFAAFPAFAFGAALHFSAGDSGAQMQVLGAGAGRAGQAGDVYINDSFESADLISKAKEFAKAQRWEEASMLVQKAIDGAGDRLVRVGDRSYSGIHHHLQQWVSTWPKAGLFAYRDLAEPALESALVGLRNRMDVNELLPLYEKYFCTAGAVELADRIGQLQIEVGDFDSAEGIYRQVLEGHPDRAPLKSRFAAMVTLVRILRGDEVKEIEPAAATALIEWQGAERRAGEVYAELSAGLKDRADAEVVVADWPIYSGNAVRNRLGQFSIDEPGLMWRFVWSENGQADAEAGGLIEMGRPQRERAREVSVSPVVADGLVYAQRFREVVALHLNSGALAWRFQADQAGPEVMSFLDDLPAAWDSVTVENGRVYAVLPVAEASYYSSDASRGASELVALDGQTGRLLWRVGGAGADERLAEIVFDSSPLAHADRVFAIGRRKRAFGFEDSYLYSFHAQSGQLKRRTHLGSASTTGLGVQSATKSIASLQGDTIFVASSLGTVAAVSSASGTVRWMRTYERLHGEEAVNLRAGRDFGSWYFNPTALNGGRVFCVPNDSANLLELSAADGSVRGMHPIEQLDGVESLLHIDGNRLIGVGTNAFIYDLAEKRMVWRSELPDRTGPLGRGFATKDLVLIPHAKGFSSFRAADGGRTDFSWDEEGEPGNLLAVADRLIVSGARGISCYVRKVDLWQALRARMQAAPLDPIPAIELSEVAFGAGEYAEAMSVLKEAIRRSSGSAAESGIRRRIFGDILKYAETLSRKQVLQKEALDLLLATAPEQASEPADHVAYRLTFAPLFEKMEQYERTVRLYQQILRDRSLRELPAPGRTRISAGSLAQTQIDRLIRQQGRQVYAEFDQEAQRFLETGRGAGDVNALRRLLDSFPNSASAPQAVVALGDSLLQGGQPESAARHYAKAYHRYPKEIERPLLMRKIADAWQSANRPEHAYQWLTKGGSEFPAFRFEVEGRIVGLLEYRDRLGELRTQVEPSRPKITPPVASAYSLELGEGQLLGPRFADEPGASWRSFFVICDAGLMAHRPHDGSAIWTEPAKATPNAELLLFRGDLAVFGSTSEVFAIEADTGSRRWSLGDQPADDPAGDWEQKVSIRALALQGDRLYVATDEGRLSAIDMRNGHTLWVHKRSPAPLGRLRALDPWIVYHVVQDGRAVLCIVDAQSGEWIDQIETNEKRPIEELFVSLDGQIIAVSAQQISSYDIESRSLRWQTGVSGNLRRGSLVMDLDAIYGSDTGADVRKIALEDGRVLWQTERLAQRADEDLTVELDGETLIVSTSSSVSGVDSATGLTLWRGTTPDKARFLIRVLTQKYVVALHVPQEPREAPAELYFYDHKSGSGALAREGGRKELGALEEIRAVQAVDGAILIQAGKRLQALPGNQ